jgi:hypothetical protein
MKCPNYPAIFMPLGEFGEAGGFLSRLKGRFLTFHYPVKKGRTVGAAITANRKNETGEAPGRIDEI